MHWNSVSVDISNAVFDQVKLNCAYLQYKASLAIKC